MRSASWGRAVVLAAGLLAVVGGFGLHPESVGADRLAAHRGLASAHTDDAPHACPVCLTHGLTLPAPATTLPSRDEESKSRIGAADLLVRGRLALRESPGRSPPDRS